MVRFTFFKDHLDIPINDKLNAKKQKEKTNQRKLLNSTDKKLWLYRDYETGLGRYLRGSNP